MPPRFRAYLRIACASVVALHLAGPALAQGTGGPPETVKMRLGPVFLNPTISLSNAGVDDNVFNDAKSAAPRSDATFTVTPRTNFWLRFGPSWLSGGVREDLVYYKENSGERSANNRLSLQMERPAQSDYIPSQCRVQEHTRASRVRNRHARAPFGRALHRTDGREVVFEEHDRGEGGCAIKCCSIPAPRSRGSNLRDELNRVTMSETVSLESQLTPLTTVAANYAIGQDRFKYNPLRDASSTTVGASIRFDPAALIKGSATIGSTTTDPTIPERQGIRARLLALRCPTCSSDQRS